MKKSYHNLVEAYSVLNRPVRLSRRHPFLVGDEAPSGCPAPSKCVLRPNPAGNSDSFSPCGTPCNPLSPSDTITYIQGTLDFAPTTFSVTYSDKSGFTIDGGTHGITWGPITTTTKWAPFLIDMISSGGYFDGNTYIYFRKVPADDGTTKGEWFMDGWDCFEPFSCLCPKPDALYPNNASSASGTISKCECKGYHYNDECFYMTFDGTYFSIFQKNNVLSFDTDQINIVFAYNKFTIRIKNDGTASYEIRPDSS
jgi:hypothetical protein